MKYKIAICDDSGEDRQFVLNMVRAWASSAGHTVHIDDFEIDVKLKCLEESVTQAHLAEMVGTSASHISRLINKQDGIVNKIFVEMLDKLGYDIQITYMKKDTN